MRLKLRFGGLADGMRKIWQKLLEQEPPRDDIPGLRSSDVAIAGSQPVVHYSLTRADERQLADSVWLIQPQSYHQAETDGARTQPAPDPEPSLRPGSKLVAPQWLRIQEFIEIAKIEGRPPV